MEDSARNETTQPYSGLVCFSYSQDCLEKTPLYGQSMPRYIILIHWPVKEHLDLRQVNTGSRQKEVGIPGTRGYPGTGSGRLVRGHRHRLPTQRETTSRERCIKAPTRSTALNAGPRREQRLQPRNHLDHLDLKLPAILSNTPPSKPR